MDLKELLSKIEGDQVKFLSLQFTDVTGAVKSLDIPVSRTERAVQEGIWFDGSSVEGFARIQESDMRLMPDIETYAVWMIRAGQGSFVISTSRVVLHSWVIREASSNVYSKM
jgi:glutamine synthetase